MGSGRVEAFSDGVIAILITIMVLELKIPDGVDLAALRPILPVFLAYVLSFVVLAIYWNNHHHMLHATEQIRGPVLWTNTHLLFWLSLIPFTTSWMGHNFSSPLPTAVYGTNLLLCGVAYTLLQKKIIAHRGMVPAAANALRHDFKGTASGLLYAAAIPLAFVQPAIADAIYVGVALMWLVPDRRIENALRDTSP